MFDYPHYTPHVFESFPDDPHGNNVSEKKIHNNVYDENFHYRANKTLKEKFLRLIFNYFVFLVLAPFVCLLTGAKFKDAKKLRKYAKEFDNKFITVSNHCYKYEMLLIRTMLYGKVCFFPIWKEGAEGKNGTGYRAGGGIPMDHSMKGMLYGYKEMEKVVNEHIWLHVFPEQAGWFYYGAVREFKDGTFRLAYQTNTPVIPIATSFRERKGFYRLLGKKNIPLPVVTVGDPIFPDASKDRKEEIERLRLAAQTSVMHLANIKDEEENERIKKEYTYYPYDPSKSAY